MPETTRLEGPIIRLRNQQACLSSQMLKKKDETTGGDRSDPLDERKKPGIKERKTFSCRRGAIVCFVSP